MSREEVNELIYYISQLKHQYNQKIDEQSDKINEQNTVIEELLWQLRELSDKVRQLNDNVKILETKVSDNSRNNSHQMCVCRYENHNLSNKYFNDVQIRGKFVHKNGDKNDSGKSNPNEDEDVYETIEFSDSSTHIYTEPVKQTPKLTRKAQKVTAKITDSPVLRAKFKDSINSRQRPKAVDKNGFRSYVQQDEYETDTDSEREEEEENVTLRLKPYKMIPAKSKKGSNKVLCSLVSDIETTYIPGMLELTDENFIHIPLQLRNASDTLIDCSRAQKAKIDTNFRVSC